MQLTPKDHRLYRRYCSLRRRVTSLFMLISVLPMLTGLDVIAQDYVAGSNRKHAQEKIDHQRLCEIAPQHLQGNIIPRLRRVAEHLQDPSLTSDQDHITDEIADLNAELKRVKLAILDNFSGQKQGVAQSHEDTKAEHLKSHTLSAINNLQVSCKQLSASDALTRQQAAARILKLTQTSLNQPQRRLPNSSVSHVNAADIELNMIAPANWAFHIASDSDLTRSPKATKISSSSSLPSLRAFASLRAARSSSPFVTAPSSLCAFVPSCDIPSSHAPSTILDISRIPHPPVLLAATDDVLSDLLPEVADPESIGPPVAADMAVAPPFLSATPAVTALADELQTPVKIFEHFRNTFVYEPYFGAVKGADKTLDDQAGNDVDIASALISVYRAAGIPCRYVYGTIRLTATQAASWLGVDAANVPLLLDANDIPHESLGTPGAGDILIDHVWVRAYVDYMPYRGATAVDAPQNNDLSTIGDSWIDIDPSFKLHGFTERRDIESQLGISTTNFLTNIRGQSDLGAIPAHAELANGSNGAVSDDNATNLPQAFILNEIIGLGNPLAQFMAQNQLTTSTVFRERIILDEVYGLLPCTDYYRVHARGAAYATFPEALAATVSLTVDNAADEQILSYSAPVAALLDRNLTLTWQAATPGDQAKIAAWSAEAGESAPVFQADIEPVLSLDTVPVAAATGSDTAGAAQMLHWIFNPAGANPSFFSQPNPAKRSEYLDIVNAGAVSAFVFDAGNVTNTQIAAIINDLEAAASTPAQHTVDHLSLLLRAVGLNYFYQSDRFAQITGGVLDLYAQRAPSLIRVSYGLEVDDLFGLPFNATATTIKTSVVRDSFTVSPVSSLGDFATLREKKSSFTYITALSSSALSANSLKQFFNENAVSPARLIQAASNQVNPVYTLRPQTDALGNPAAVIDASVFDDLFLTISPATQDMVLDLLNRGWSVTVTRDPVAHGGLSRDPLIAVDPITGDSGFFLFASGHAANLAAGAELKFLAPPFAVRDLFMPDATIPLPSTVSHSAIDWLYALDDSTINTGIAYLPAITHVKNFLSRPNSPSDSEPPTSNLQPSTINLSSLKTTTAAIALIGRIDEISQKPGIVNFSAAPEIFSPNGDTVNDTLSIDAVTTKTSSWSIQFFSSSGQQVAQLTPADNVPPDTGNPSRINIEWDGRDDGDTALPDGRYDYVATANGVGGATLTTSVVIDATAPTAGLSVQNVDGPEQAVIVFTGTANDVNLAGYQIDIIDNATDAVVLSPFAGNLSVINGNFGSLSEFTLENGDYTARLTVTDRGGSTTTVQTSVFTIDHPDLDATPPTLTVDSPLTAPDAGIHSGLVPVNVSAFDENGIALIQIHIDGALVAQALNRASLNHVVDLSAINDGIHTLDVIAVDPSGNDAGFNEIAFFSSRHAPDLRPPTLDLQLPDTTAALPSPVNLGASASDNDLLELIIIRVDGAVVASQSISGASATGTLSHGLAVADFTDAIHTVTVQATDVSGNIGEKTLVIPAADDAVSPTIAMVTSADNAAAAVKGDITVQLTASDDHDIRQILLYLDNMLVHAHVPFPPLLGGFAASRETQFTIPASSLLDGTHTITARVVDLAGNIAAAAPVAFTSSNPIANFEITPAEIRPGLPTGTQATVTATLQQDAPWTLSFTGPQTIPDIAGANRLISETVDVAGVTDGEYTVKLTVTGVAEKPSAAFVVDLVTGPPIADIANIADDAMIRDGLFDLEGTADDPDSTDDVSYKITVRKPNGAFVRDVTPGPVNAQGFHQGRVPASGPLGAIDFTLIENGVYDLVLSVRAGTDTRTDTVRFCLESQLKVGQFSFSQQDLLIPVAGQPLAVIRTYNSLNPDSGDFGRSWTWSIADVEMELDEDRGAAEDLVSGSFFSQRFGGGRNVTLTLPDGRRTTFAYTLERVGNFAFRAKWLPPPGVNATLKPTVSDRLITLFFGLQYWEASGPQTPIEYYDFPGFVLTLEDGSEYLIERESLGAFDVLDDSGESYFVEPYGEGTLRQIKQPAGDRVEFNGDRIDHFSAANEKTKSIVFDRDTQDRIVAVYDPNNLDANDNPIGPAAYTYEYDGANNLEKVNRLVDNTDLANPVYETTTFVYGKPEFPHYITEIQDPRGVTPMRNEYDSDGRLIAVIDAFGCRIDLQHNIGDRTETIFDRQGNPTIHIYDTRGNVVSTTDALGSTTTRAYDNDDNETAITDALGNTTSFTYDASDNRTSVTDALGNTTLFSYDARGNQLTVTDALGNTTTNEYDAANNLTATVNALGQRTENTYDGSGNLTATRDALGTTTATFGYDGSGNLTSTTDAFGFSRTFGYDGNGNQTGTSFTWINPDNGGDSRTVTTQTIYDAAGQVTRTIDPEGNQSSTVYNRIGKPVQTTDRLDNTTVTTYDARGNVIETEFADGTVTCTVYDDNGRAVVTSDRFDPDSPTPINGSRTIYDVAGRVIRSERLGDIQVDIVADGNNGLTSEFVFADRVIAASESVYDAAGRVIESVNADGEVTRFEYDAAGRQTAVIDALGNRTEFEYDAAGRQTLVRDTLDRETTFEYDALGRRTQTLFADGTSTTTSYNELGQRIAETDQAGVTRKFEYDTLGRLSAVNLPAIPDPENNDELVEPRYEYDYDVYGRLTTIRDPKSRETRFTYDELGRQLTRTLPLGQTESQAYNELGQLHTRIDFKEQITEFLYDGLGRVTTKNLYENQSFFDSRTPNESISFAYDDLGRQSAITETIYPHFDDPSATPPPGEQPTIRVTRFIYDHDGRLVSIDSPEGRIFYEYDPVTGRKTRTFTANSDILYDYDQLGRLSAVTVLKQNGVVLTEPEVTFYSYTDVGSREAIDYANGTRTAYEYDSQNRLTNLTNFGGSNEMLSSYSYSLAPNGRRTGVTETRLEADDTYSATGITYTYDALNRLTQEASGSDIPDANFNTVYTYDLVGNRLEKSTTTVAIPDCDPAPCLETTNYIYNANDQLLTESTSGPPSPTPTTTAYTNDPNGSVISKTKVNPDTNDVLESYAYTYNLENRLAFAQISRTEDEIPIEIAASYLYNQSGLRVRADSTLINLDTNAIFDNGRTFLLDPNNHTGYSQVLEEYSTTGATTPTTSYTIGDDVISQSTAAGTSVLMYDGHGSTRLLINATGLITDRYSFDAYGELLGGNPTASAPATTSLLYSGEQFDTGLQQQYLRARYYDQNVGRFNRLDPFEGGQIDPQSIHKYAYVHGDPINGLDPSGLVNLTSVLSAVAIISIVSNIALTVIQGKLHDAKISTIAWRVTQNLAFFGAIAGAILLTGWVATVAAVTVAVAGLIGLVNFVVSWPKMSTQDRIIGVLTMATYFAFAGAVHGLKPVNAPPTIPDVSPMPEGYFVKASAVDMRGAPATSPRTALGFPRNAKWYWKEVLSKHPEFFDATNTTRINGSPSRSPIVNQKWIDYHPQHASFRGQKLIHHHVSQGPIAVAVPESIHRAWTKVLHPEPRINSTD